MKQSTQTKQKADNSIERNLGEARLIAAAPDLLEACQAFIKEFDRNGIQLTDGVWNYSGVQALDKCRRVIAKATGNA